MKLIMQLNCIIRFICTFAPMRSETLTARLDKIGMTASTFCAIHCAVVPFIISTLPLWGLGFLAEEWVEISMIVLALMIGMWSLGLSWRKHRKMAALLIFAAGFAFIGMGHAFGHGSDEHLFLSAGGLTVALAHYVNWRLTLAQRGAPHSKKGAGISK